MYTCTRTRLLPVSLCFVLLIVIGSCQTSCKKKSGDSGDLPPASQTGENKFAFLLDADVWLPSLSCKELAPSCSLASVSVQPAEMGDTDRLIMRLVFIRLDADKKSSIVIETKSPLSGEKATIDTPGDVYDSLSIVFQSEQFTDYLPNSSNRGTFIITKLDRTKQIISGNFAFTLYASGEDSVVISSGRFDTKFSYCHCQ